MIDALTGTSSTLFKIGLGSNQVQLVNDSGILKLKDAGGTPYVPGANQNVLICQEQQNSGVNGGNFNSGSWQTRQLNTASYNNITGSTLLSGQISLPPGNYIAYAWATSYNVGTNQLRFYDVTNFTEIALGSSVSDGNAILLGAWVASGTASYELQHFCATTEATDGFGKDAGTGSNNVYSQILILSVKSFTGPGSSLAEEFFTVDATIQSTSQITLSNSPLTGTELVFLGGLKQREGLGADYTISGPVVTFDPSVSLVIGTEIEIRYQT
jgi:hypothetical protein